MLPQVALLMTLASALVPAEPEAADWTRVSFDGAGILSLALDDEDPRRLAALGASGLYVSEDEGASWRRVERDDLGCLGVAVMELRGALAVIGCVEECLVVDLESGQKRACEAEHPWRDREFMAGHAKEWASLQRVGKRFMNRLGRVWPYRGWFKVAGVQRGHRVWLAHTQAGVYRSGDGGRSFAHSSKGMKDRQVAWFQALSDKPGAARVGMQFMTHAYGASRFSGGETFEAGWGVCWETPAGCWSCQHANEKFRPRNTPDVTRMDFMRPKLEWVFVGRGEYGLPPEVNAGFAVWPSEEDPVLVGTDAGLFIKSGPSGPGLCADSPIGGTAAASRPRKEHAKERR